MMSGVKINYLNNIAGFILVSVLFFPDISISGSLPTFQFLDFLVPLLGGIIVYKRRSVSWNIYYSFILLFVVYIFLTIIINNRTGVLRDYFELYKFIKYLVILVFFTLIDVKLFLKTWIKPLFIGLVIVNLLHFFNVFNFNYLLEKYYDGGLNISLFGKNTLGEPVGKRMVGMVGNPNNNAIVLAFFMLFFFPFSLDRKKAIWFFVALTMVFLCQSRTSIMVFAAIIIVVLAFRTTKWTVRDGVIFFSLVLTSYFIAWGLSSRFFEVGTYGNTVFSEDVLKTNSVMGRLETWRFLGGMIAEKPIFGHGPNKDFFYDNTLYSESEYFLYAWRYGMIGLFMYLLIYFIPFKTIFYSKNRNKYSRYILIIVTLMCVTAITNNPFTERTVVVLFAASLGILYRLTQDKTNKEINFTV